MCDETQYTLESAKKICKNFRFELLEDKYINARTNMKVKDEYIPPEEDEEIPEDEG